MGVSLPKSNLIFLKNCLDKWVHLMLILDEPLAGLDEKTQDMLIEFLQSFHKAGKTLITVTHNRHLAELLGTRFALMNEDHELNMI